MRRITFTVNGREHSLEVSAGLFLLEALRDHIGLTGSKVCCVEGECGACTVIMDGRAVNSCLILAAEVDGANIVTVEGLGLSDLSPLQEAFLDQGAAQCGFCIPGQLMAARALLERNPNPSRAEVHEALAGNLCRCAGYEQITEAVLDASRKPA